MLYDDFDPLTYKPAPTTGGGLGFGFKQLSQIAKLVAPWLHKPGPLEEMQARLVAVNLAKALQDGTTAYAVTDWQNVVPQTRSDHIIIGSRGRGKTAFSALIAQTLAKSLDQPVYAVDWPAEAAGTLGFTTPERAVWFKARKAIVLLDEAKLRMKDSDLWEMMALARQRGVSLIYTTQTLAALSRDVLRLDATLWARGLDPLSARFEREEVVDLAAQIIGVQTAAGFSPETPQLVLRATKPFVVTASPLPNGWTENISKLWS